MTSSCLDHLVVACSSLDEGMRWCKETLGIVPNAGGKHPLMGTHNRVFRIDAPGFSNAYFEIIAIDPAAQAPLHKRWFDLDDAAMQAKLRAQGPQLIHWVARCDDAGAAAESLKTAGIHRGPLLDAQRETPGGLLQWRISVRDDGERLFDGVLPTLIEWKGTHPVDNMAPSSVNLRSLRASHPKAALLRDAFHQIGWAGVDIDEGPPRISAVLDTPKGRITLSTLEAGLP